MNCRKVICFYTNSVSASRIRWRGPVDSTDNAAQDVPVAGKGQNVSITDNDHLQGRLVSLLILRLQPKICIPATRRCSCH